jgi:hypothetical protein
MNCQRIEGVISDLARDQMVEAHIRDDVLAHCKVCADCARALEDQRALSTVLHSLAKSWQSVDAPETIQRNLTLALRGQTPKPEGSHYQYHWQYWVAAVAATLLLFFSIGLVRWYKAPKQISKTFIDLADTTSALTSSQPGTAVMKDREERANVKPETAKNRHRRFISGRRNSGRRQTTNPATVARYESSEIATGFLPIRYGNALNLQDGGQIVRVEVPRSTLVRFGLPVNIDRFGERVKADLLLGVDGSARAIRFIQ